MSFLLLVALISFSKSNENDLDMVLLDMILLDEFENDGGSFFVSSSSRGPSLHTTQVDTTSKIPARSGTPAATLVVPRTPFPTVTFAEDVIFMDADDEFNVSISDTATFALNVTRNISSIVLGSLIVLPGVEVWATNLTIKRGLELRGSAKLLAEDGASIVIAEGVTIAMAIAGTDIPTLDLGQNSNWLTNIENIAIDVEFLATRLPLEELEKLVWPLIIGGNVGNDQDAWREKANFTEPTDAFRFDFDKYPGPSSARRLIQDDRQALYLKGKGKDSDTTGDDGYEPSTGTPPGENGLTTGAIIGIAVAVVVLVVAIVIIIICLKGKGKSDESGEKKSKKGKKGERVPSSSNSDNSSSSST